MSPLNVEKTAFTWGGGTVSGVWHHPERGGTYLVLAHGAGGNLHTPSLVRLADALSARGVGAVRFNFPYTEAGRKVPDPQARLEACYRGVAKHVGERATRLFLGGRSMGGRIASHTVAAGFPAAGLVFLGYPLHPPGHPERIRDAHLDGIAVPMLFIQGSRDTFARPELLARTLGRLMTATLYVLQDGDHSLTVRGRAPAEIIAELVKEIVAWMEAAG